MDQPSHSAGSLQSGSTLGPYTIREPIGAGGMGQVYRAYDAKLGRDVAVKVVTSVAGTDAALLQRLEREARILASLSHPNIAAIYGLEESGGAPALVMELVGGPTLADRIAQKPLSLDESLAIARQLADALEYAHERGVVHRDLKPSNIKVSGRAAVKVLDFGIAKALRDEGVEAGTAEGSATPGLTQPGTVLGTPAYMAPEQAEGNPADRRSDVWAFGCVLYEMLTDRPPFQGRTAAATIASVLGAEPDWQRLPAATPPSVRALLGRCLTKDPRRRLQAMGDARIVLEDALAGASPAISTDGQPRPRARGVAWSAAAVLVFAAAGWVAGRHFTPSVARPGGVTRFAITLPAGQALANRTQPMLALSRDGTELAYVATSAEAPAGQIYVRPLARTEARAIAGTGGAEYPFFSPDGEWLGYFADGKLKKVPVGGGASQTLADDALPLGGAWCDEHTITFATYGSALIQVADTGGLPYSSSRLEKGEEAMEWPSCLPGGEAVAFSTRGPAPAIGLQRAGAGDRLEVMRVQTETMPMYVASGHLVFREMGTLKAVPFDIGRLRPRSSNAIPVVDNVAAYAVSANGTLAFVAGSTGTGLSRLVWVGRDGTEQVLGAPARPYNQPRLDPHGRRIAVDVTVPTEQVWAYDPASDRLEVLTFEGMNRHATWSPDGKRLAIRSERDGPPQIYLLDADGSGRVVRLTTNDGGSGTADIPYSWSPDGRLLAYVHLTSTSGSDVMVMHVDDPARRTDRVMHVSSGDAGPEFSPDGHWLAYASDDDSGRRQVYVQAYPGPGGKHQISTDGGNEPRWGHDPAKLELFYRHGNAMMAVDIATRPTFAAAKPHVLFEGPYVTTNGAFVRANYDVSADDRRFLMLKPVDAAPGALTEIDIVLNWTEELRRQAASGG
jgi:Tol biopolymer transport system component